MSSNSSSTDFSAVRVMGELAEAVDPDAPLAAAAKAGNLAAYEQLVHRHHQRLLGFLRGRLDTTADAEDVAQQTFVKAWRNMHRFDCNCRFSPWLYTIAARLAISHHRKRKYCQLPDLEREPAPADRVPIEDEARTRLWQIARDGLATAQFEALWLFYRGELSIKDTASAMGKTQVHVKVLLFRGRTALGKLLRQQGLTDTYRSFAS
jgi:RNA polymerase sigma-70 factor (ECF subfamily)